MTSADVDPMPASPFSAEAVLDVAAPDGTPIAVFGVEPAGAVDPAADTRPPLLLIHGASADHTTFRVVGPVLARSRRVYALDRRGRGASGDGTAYSIEREYDDVAAVADVLVSATRTTTDPAATLRMPGVRAADRGAVDVLGHSYGGRCALGAGLRSLAIRRVVAYEGAPVPSGVSYRPADLLDELRRHLDRGDDAAALDAFLTGVVGMSSAALQAYHHESVWPARVAAARTILRELEAESGPSAGLGSLRALAIPVLLILGSASRPPFRIGTDALASVLPHARIAVIEGAAHAAHHSHPAAFVDVVESFLDG